MKTISYKIIFLLFAFAIFAFDIVAQQTAPPEPSDERSRFEGRKKSIMAGNLLRATYHNAGHAGRTGGQNIDELLFEFPRNTNREYMFFMSVQFGTEVEDQLTPGVKIPMVNVAAFRTSRVGNLSWTMNPISGYFREDSDEMARSDLGPNSPIENTWPNVWPDKLLDGGDGWAGSWNGFFGRDQFNADVEFFYKAGDDTYTRFSAPGRYRPDETDPSRGGLGIIMDARILAWSQTLVAATHFSIFEIRNDASFDYEQMAFGLWIADFVGGNANDRPQFDDLISIVYLTDIQRFPSPPAFDGLPVGEMGIKFLETPSNDRDGIDNDGDSDFYDPTDTFFNPQNVDLYFNLTLTGGGFYSADTLRNQVVRRLTAIDFQTRTILPGDKIVLIQDNDARVIATYPVGGGTVVSQGRTINLPPSGLSIREDLLPQTDPNFGNHVDGIDNDLDGIIDESTPNHLTKSTFVNGSSVTRAVRHINYLFFEPGDTLEVGNIVPNQTIRARMAADSEFRTLVEDFHEGRLKNRFTSAPMIDESRADFFDNDQDWVAVSDDVGIEGDRDRPSRGAGNGKPDSGVGTTFPGEPSIDKTDVTESDLIGVTRASIFNAGSLSVDQDADIWTRFLVPGNFVRVGAGADEDVYVSSGMFALRRGEIQRFAVAVSAVQPASASVTREQDRAELNRNLDEANTVYEADFQFAVAPTPPIVQVVEGDGFVTIYWDDSSEQSFDRFVERITGNGNDFQGYRLYKSTEPSFEEVRSITNAFGSPQFFNPLRIFDKTDGISGFSPVDVNGIKYNLGTDSGLEYQFTDTDVQNGKRYYYAVTAFDAGIDFAGIAPSESPIQISQSPSGRIFFGQNVKLARPSKSRAGIIDPDNPSATAVAGSASGRISVDIVDRNVLRPQNVYAITFEDTVFAGSGEAPDTLRTKNFTLMNITGGARDTLIGESTNFNGELNPITQGFTVTLENEDRLTVDQERTRFEAVDGQPRHRIDFNVWREGTPKVADYYFVIGDFIGFGQSTERTVAPSPSTTVTLPSVPTNFKVFNALTGDSVKYAFFDNPRANRPPPLTPRPDSMLSASASLAGGLQTDIVILIEDVRDTPDTLSYRLQLAPLTSGGAQTSIDPQPGDTIKVFTTKPFTRGDRFEFTFEEENLVRFDTDSAKKALDEVLVIPNPYKVASAFEIAPANVNDRQQRRELHFTGVPAPSTLRIFTISGTLVREIKIGVNDLLGGQFGGTYVWNMLTKDNLEISYGVYLFHIDAPGVGEKTGKFAVIK